MTCDDTAVDLPAAWRYSGVVTWYGRQTRRWWALVPWPSARHGALLVEAAGERELAWYVRELLEGARW
ncbi:hypothetical protein E1200_18345 [Actinomadura sp. GC306]|uniref:hypothetical protein n=1 Tax=Actinomadura sp. GC306 TaxID=2530367 RepID=UPI00105299BB|nr:hypothetical protein [Actinomadura sp. GC306]TDC65480.1 hypothetical protein E1200_18345 [Actinomadura sp. GC306]